MKRQIVIFAIAWLLIALLGIFYLPRISADVADSLPVWVDVLGTTFTLRPVGNTLSPVELSRAQQVMKSRLDQLNLTGRYKIVAFPESAQFQVTLPDTSETPHIINVITHVGDIAFVDGGLESPPLGERITLQADPSERAPLQLEPLFLGQDISAIVSPAANSGDLFYQIKLKLQPAGQFNGPGKGYVCLVLDAIVANCSKMYQWSDNTLEILPDLGETGVRLSDLGVFLESGPLPAPFEVVN